MLQTMRALASALVLAACGQPPPPKPVVVEKPVQELAEIAGQWVASDDLDWSYKLSVGSDGAVLLAVDRNKMGRCELHAHLVRGSRAPSFELEVSLDECHRDRAPGPIELRVPSFDGTRLVVELVDAGQTDRHTFTRLVQ
jgi:hypothetical protein